MLAGPLLVKPNLGELISFVDRQLRDKNAFASCPVVVVNMTINDVLGSFFFVLIILFILFRVVIPYIIKQTGIFFRYMLALSKALVKCAFVGGIATALSPLSPLFGLLAVGYFCLVLGPFLPFYPVNNEYGDYDDYDGDENTGWFRRKFFLALVLNLN